MSYQYARQATQGFAERITALGFPVYVAKSGTHGFFTDPEGRRVVSFQFEFDESLSGNYGPPSKYAGTGWKMATSPNSLRTADDVTAALTEEPPRFCPKGENGWQWFTTRDQHLKVYGQSSGYQLFEAGS